MSVLNLIGVVKEMCKYIRGERESEFVSLCLELSTGVGYYFSNL